LISSITSTIVKIQRTLPVRNALITELIIIHKGREFANFPWLYFFFLLSDHVKLVHTVTAFTCAWLLFLIELTFIIKNGIVW
jgi:hypothetical protein